MTALIPRQVNRDSMTVGDGLGLLHDAGFVIAGLQAEFTHDGWLVHVVLRDPGHHILHVSRLVDGKRVYVLFEGGIERNGQFVPFDTLTAVTHALTFATLVADRQIELAVIA